MEKRLFKRIIVKARGSFHLEDFEIRSPGDKPIEKSDMAGGRDADKEGGKRRRRRKQILGSPAEVEALLEEEERNSVNPETLAEGYAEDRERMESVPAAEPAAPVSGEPAKPTGT